MINNAVVPVVAAFAMMVGFIAGVLTYASKASDYKVDLTQVPTKTFMNAGGSDPDGVGRALKVDREGNVYCVPPWPTKDAYGTIHEGEGAR